MIRYYVNEFIVESDFPLPLDAEAGPLATDREVPTVVLRRASLVGVPSMLRRVRRQLVYDVGDGFLIEQGTFTLHIDLKARVLTVDCTDERLPGATAWAFHAGLGAATVMHGGVPLHGAGLEVGGRYVALMAASGTGKSTLAWSLLQRGARFGNDDLVPAYVTGATVTAYPSAMSLPKLDREAVDRYELDPAALRPVEYGTGEIEYYAPVARARRAPAPAPLAAVFLLRPEPPYTDSVRLLRMCNLVSVRCLPEAEATAALRSHLHVLWLIGKWVDSRRIAALCVALAARVPVYALSYPRAYAMLPEVGRVIRHTIGAE